MYTVSVRHDKRLIMITSGVNVKVKLQLRSGKLKMLSIVNDHSTCDSAICMISKAINISQSCFNKDF